jgi:glutamate-1-semialdehyde aminotransferase
MTALRLARGVTGKNKIIKFNGCYHGHVDSMLIKAGSGLAGQAEASSKGVTEQQAGDTLVCELGDLNEVKQVFEQHPKDIAAIFIEPLLGHFRVSLFKFFKSPYTGISKRLLIIFIIAMIQTIECHNFLRHDFFSSRPSIMKDACFN